MRMRSAALQGRALPESEPRSCTSSRVEWVAALQELGRDCHGLPERLLSLFVAFMDGKWEWFQVAEGLQLQI